MHINTRVNPHKAKVAKRIALDLDHSGGWPQIIDLALDLYVEHYGVQVGGPQPLGDDAGEVGDPPQLNLSTT